MSLSALDTRARRWKRGLRSFAEIMRSLGHEEANRWRGNAASANLQLAGTMARWEEADRGRRRRRLFYTEDKTRLRRAMHRRPPGSTRPFRLRRLQSADGFLKAHSREPHCCRLILAKGLGTPPAADKPSQSVASDSRQHFVAHQCGCCRAGDRTCCLVRPIFGRTGARSWLMAQPLD